MTADNRCGKITADKEKQRAVSREAARIRRKAESDVLGDLSRLLPLPAAVRSHLDKPSVMRLTISYMQTRSLLSGIGGTLTKTQHAAKHRPLPGRGEGGDNVERSSQRWEEEEEAETKEKAKKNRVEEQEEEEATEEKKKRRVEEKEEWRGPLWQREETDVYLRVLEGFVLAVSPDGDMICMSANVTKYLGLTQAELMGHNIYEFTHPCDHDEIRSNLRLTAAQCAGDHCVGSERTFIMRMKSTITHRGRATNLKAATWRVFLCRGRVKVCSMAPCLAPCPDSVLAPCPDSVPVPSCLLLTCQSLPASHSLLSNHTFTSQHSMDMRFTHCDQRVTALLGYSPGELQGRSVYELCHALDTHCLTKNHLNLCSKHQSVTGVYRMLVKGGGYIWVESHSAVLPRVVRASRTTLSPAPPLCILCVNYVLSGVEEPSLQLSLDQTVCRHSKYTL